MIEVSKTNGRYVIVEGDETLISSTDSEWVTLYVNEFVNFHLARLMGGMVRIHAASGSFKGKCFVLAGEKGAGKTTLITRLLLDGVGVHGDERVLVRRRQVIAMPRKFHLKEGSIALIPELGPICKRLTSYPTSYGGRVRFFDPLDAGFEWQIRWGKVDVIFYVEPSHGKKTECRTCPKWLMAQKLLMQSVNLDSDPEPQIGDLCDVVNGSESFVLRVGDLSEASGVVTRVLS